MATTGRILSEKNSNKIRNMGILCAFLVVLIHCRPNFEFGTVGWWLKEVLENGVTHIAVPFFFVVTGYMLAKDIAYGGGYKCAITKRARTLLIPFVIWNCLFWLLKLGVENLAAFVNGRTPVFWVPSLRQMGLWYTGCPLLSPLWYVRAILVLAVLSPVLIFMVRKFRVVFLCALLVAYAVLCPFWPVPNAGEAEEFFRVGVFPVLGVFYLSCGIAIYEGVVDKTKLRLNPSVSVAAGLLIVGVRAVCVYNGMPGAQYLGLACIPFLLYGCWGLISGSRWPGWLVLNTFSVYLIHKFFLFCANVFVSSGASVFSYVGMAAVAFSASLAVAVAMKKWLPGLSRIMFGGR